mgnify:CR=1 FL=1
MNNTIYQAEPPQGISVPSIIIILVFIILLIYGIIMWKNNPEVRIIDKIGPFVVDGILLICIISVTITSIDSKYRVWNEYTKGNYLIAKGTIGSYEEVKGISETDIKYDSFIVSDIEFHVPGFVTVWGYPLRQVDGGVLKNGMNVEIYYIPYKFENVIMKIELLESD